MRRRIKFNGLMEKHILTLMKNNDNIENIENTEYYPDLYYKKLFSHSILVKELLFLIFEEKLHTFGFDFDTLKLEKNEFVFEFDNILIERKSDCIWSIKLKGKKIYIFFHLEFQRTVDKTIAQRTKIYRELAEIDFIKSKSFRKVKGNVPPIISIVLYNGNQNYTAPKSKNGVVYFDNEIKQIFDTLNLEYPVSESNKNTYYLIDETKWKNKNDNNSIRNFCEAIFLLEQCKSSKDFDNIIQEIERIKEETLQQIKSQDINDEWSIFLKDFALWISSLLNHLYSKNKDLFPIITKNLENIKDNSMFVENFAKGFRKELKAAKEEGKIEGKIEGKKETFFDGIFALLSNKFSDYTDNIKQKILQLNPKSFDLSPYINIIFCSKNAEDAYNKIAKFASS